MAVSIISGICVMLSRMTSVLFFIGLVTSNAQIDTRQRRGRCLVDLDEYQTCGKLVMCRMFNVAGTMIVSSCEGGRCGA